MDKEQRDPGAELARLIEAMTEPFARLLENMRPLFELAKKVAEDPGVQAYIAARKAGHVPEPQQACHCLCGKAHPADKGVCDGEAVTTRRYVTQAMGPVDVSLCAPCAVAQGLAGVAPRG